MTYITSANVTESKTHSYFACASDLEWGPGSWPKMLDTNLGNTLPFVLRNFEYDSEGDVTGAYYIQSNGCITLRIFND